ncbi:MAG: hypothetical protein NUV57_02045 [archaeon]|nr:hypothetical protein [archaeon]
MDERFRNLAFIVGAMIVVVIAYFVVLPALGEGSSSVSAGSFSEGLSNLDSIVEKNNVSIVSFKQGEIFTLDLDGTLENNYLESQFQKLKKELRDFKSAIASNNSSDSKALGEVADLYIEIVELNEKRKAIFEKASELESLESCDAMNPLLEMYSLEGDYEFAVNEFNSDADDFAESYSSVEGIEDAYLYYAPDITSADVELTGETIETLLLFCE